MNAGTIISTVADETWFSRRTADHRYVHPTVHALPRQRRTRREKRGVARRRVETRTEATYNQHRAPPWSSGQDACLSRRRSPVRSRLGVLEKSPA